ncbi:MAG: Ldh family oxidoreductase [Rhodobacteraceae bacterium]|nr:Ldh family oxidoreductase [Paracoccaceae bacterium]
MQKTRVSLADIETTARTALMAHGALGWIADEVAKAVRMAEATGNVICGLYYLESYCKQLLSGRVKGNVEPLVRQARPAAIEVDALYGFAQPAFARGLDMAVAAAREMGSCAFAIRHSHTCTSLGYFTEQIAGKGLIGLGFTNASAVVAPPGGNKPVLGTNPMAMAVPARQGGVAFQFDQSTSAIAMGKITMAASAGQPIPLGWAVDADGNPTTDAKAALKGSMLSMGGYKGWGLGLMVEMLAACLTGTINSLDSSALKAPDGPPHNFGQFYFLLDPEVFAGEAFWQGLQKVSDAVAAQPGARLPGANRRLPEAVEIDADLWVLAQALAQATPAA